MPKLHNGNELCDTCNKPYIALPGQEPCKCEIDASHTDPTQKDAAAVLKYRQRARVAEELNEGLQKENQRMRVYLYGVLESDGNIDFDEVYIAVHGK